MVLLRERRFITLTIRQKDLNVIETQGNFTKIVIVIIINFHFFSVKWIILIHNTGHLFEKFPVRIILIM